MITPLEKLIGVKVRSVYGLTGQVVATTQPLNNIIIQMDDGRTNKCNAKNFDVFYRIISFDKSKEMNK